MKNESASQNLTSKVDEPGSPARDNKTPQEITRLTTHLFQEILIGQFFEFRGRRYQKLALSMAIDEDRNGNIFQAQTEVLPDLVASLADRKALVIPVATSREKNPQFRPMLANLLVEQEK